MKWTYGIKNKLTASAVLFLLCLLVLISNYIDRNHTDNVKNSISTLYEDRLIAEEYILNMTAGFYQIREMINHDTSKVKGIHFILLNIIEENNAYQKTKFTPLEREKADEFSRILNEFETIPSENIQKRLKWTTMAIGKLKELSAIQLEESKKIMAYVETLYAAGKTSSQFVFALIIIILVVLQALVFASKTIIPKEKPKSHHLN